MTKTEKARAFDAQKLVDKFNELYPIGSKVMLRKIAIDNCPYEEHVVISPAFCTAGYNAVAFFEGVSGYCSIDDDFIKY